MSKLGDRPSFLRLVRWVAACLLIALGLTLSATSLSGYLVVRGALQTVVQGQGEALIQAVDQALFNKSRKDAATDEEVLRSVLDNETLRGLRCVVLLDPAPGSAAGATPAQPQTQPAGAPQSVPGSYSRAGDCLTKPEQWAELGTRMRHGEMLPIDTRMRMVRGAPPIPPGAAPPPGVLLQPYGVPPPPGAPWPAPPVQPGAAAPPPGPAWPGPVPQALLSPTPTGRPTPLDLRRPRAMFIEFVPRMAEQLSWSAVRTLLTGGIATLALVIGAVIFWKLSLREERAYATNEQKRQLASLGEMAAVLAHELRNPLAALKGHAQLLVEQLPAGSRPQDKANRVVSEAERLEALSEDLLSFVRTTVIEPREVNPTEFVTDCAAAIGDPRIEVAAAQAPPRCRLDPERMRQVLSNLLRNALEASPADGRVLAKVSREGNQLVITVRDFGKGIRAQDLERIFEPFYTTRARGTGLGLPIARRLVALHGGTLTADNSPDGGAIFCIRLPAALKGAGRQADR